MRVFQFLLPLCPPMRFSGEKWTTCTARCDYRETKSLADRNHVSRFRTWSRNRGQYMQATRIDFSKRARRIAPSACVCAYIRFFLREMRIELVHTSNAYAALWGDWAIFIIQNVLFFFSIKPTRPTLGKRHVQRLRVTAFVTLKAVTRRFISRYFNYRGYVEIISECAECKAHILYLGI